jgi:hypothetical protein
MNYSIGIGTVQPYISGPDFFQHFGRAAYDRNIPVLSDSLREQAEPIVAALNYGEISHERAKKLLAEIWY